MYYNFVMTCCACPEQYDVLDGDGVPIAYVRYRHGLISVHPYLEMETQDYDSLSEEDLVNAIDLDNIIYEEKIGGELDGQFLDNDRDDILNDIDKRIYEYYND